MKLYHLIWGELNAVMAQMSWLRSAFTPDCGSELFGVLNFWKIGGGRSRRVLGVLSQPDLKLLDA